MISIYNVNDLECKGRSIGTITQYTNDSADEERNGQNFHEMEVFHTDPDFKKLKMGVRIKTDTAPKLKKQIYIITDIKKTHAKKSKVRSVHASYLTLDQQIRKEIALTNVSCQMALDTLFKNTTDKTPFSCYSNITNLGSINLSVNEVENVRQVLGGVKGSFLDVFGGEYEFDNYMIRLLSNRGVKKNTTISYGKNLQTIEQDESIASTYTSLYPKANINIQDDEEENVSKLITLPGSGVVDSETVNSFPFRKVLTVDFSDKVKDNMTKKQCIEMLEKEAKKYIKDNKIGYPKVKLKVSFLDLSKTLEYKDYKELEQIDLCDIVTVKFEELGIDVEAKVIKTSYSKKLGRYNYIEIGEPKYTLYDRIKDIDNTVKETQKNSNDALISANGKNTNFYGPDEPKANKEGDMWFKELGNGDYEMYQWNGVVWEKVSFDNSEIEKELEQHKKDIDKSLEQSEQAINESNLSIEKAEKAEQEAIKAIEEAGFIGSELENTKETIGIQEERITELDKTTVSNGNQIEKLGTGLKETITKTDDNGKQITQINKDYNGLSTTVVDLKKDFNNLELPARNLVRDSLIEGCNENYPFIVLNTVEEWEKDADYHMLLKGDIKAGSKVIFYGQQTSGQVLGELTYEGNSLYSYYGKIKENVTDFKNILKIYITPGGLKQCVDWVAVYKNDPKTKEWYPALEDNSKNTSKLWTEVKQQSEKINAQAGKIEDGEIKLSEVELMAEGLQVSVGNKADKSEVTQLAGQITSVIKDNATANLFADSELTYNLDNLNVISNPKNIIYRSDATLTPGSKNTLVFNYEELKKRPQQWNSIASQPIATSGIGKPFSASCYVLVAAIDEGSSVFPSIEFLDGDMKRVHVVDGKRIRESSPFVKIDVNEALCEKPHRYVRLLLQAYGYTQAYLGEFMLNKGKKVAPYRPGGISQSQITQTKEMILESIKDSDGKFTTVQKTIDGIQATVKNKADKSEVTQLANLFDVRVSGIEGDAEENYAALNILKDNINWKVNAKDIISQINLSPETILIQSKKIMLDGQVNINDAFIKKITINTAYINHLKTVSFDAAQITSGFINSNRIQAKSITTDKLATNAIQVGFNAIGSTIKISPNSLSFYSGSTLAGEINSQGVSFYSGTRPIGHIGVNSKAGDSSVKGLVMDLNYSGDFVTWGFMKSASASTYSGMLTLDPKGKFTGEAGVHIPGLLHLNKIRPVGNPYQNLSFTSIRLNSTKTDYPALMDESFQNGIAFGSDSLYIINGGNRYPFDKVSNLLNKLSGLGKVAIPTGFDGKGNVQGWRDMYL